MSKPVIKLVGGASIRAKGSNWGDFFDYGTKLTFPEIPDNTIWIDRGLERYDFLSAALQGLNELEFTGHMTKDQIIDKDRLIDLWLRRSCAPQDKDADIYVGEYHSSLVHTGDMKVYLVNGEAVRDYVAELLKNLPESDAMKQAYTEWIEGGNGYKYPWIIC